MATPPPETTSTLRSRLAVTAVLLSAHVCLGYGVHKVPIASAMPDPVSKIRAQDEALYCHLAMRMAQLGDWATPVFLGRFLLYKPPMLAWLSGLSAKAFGVSALVLRLPALFAGAFGVALVFVWLRRLRPDTPLVAFAGAVLLLSNPLWHTLSRVCQTDVLLAACVLGALYLLFRDPRLERRTTVWGFAALTASAILAKSVAGLIPLLVLAPFYLLVPDGQRPPLRRTLWTAALALALAAPWHLYQIAVHPQWFWADYVQLQLFGFGIKPPSQVSGESHAMFYLKRLAWTDPVLCLLVLLAAPAAFRAAWRRTSVGAVLLIGWLVVMTGALFVFQYRSIQYLLAIVPALVLAAIAYGPLTRSRNAAAALLAALCVLYPLKAHHAAEPWGLPFGETRPMPAARILRDYAARQRPNALMLVSSDDDFYATTLSLPKIRYLWLDPENRTAAYGPHFVYLGITMPADQFNDLPRWRELYRERLRSWGLDSDEPLATAIVARTQDEIADLIARHPDSDFYLPVEWSQYGTKTHKIVPLSAQKALLLAHNAPGSATGREPTSR